ncbi:MAG TPA: extensin family protein [Lichenihabitans sp.]|nr:extensin family protein [Lichenihabitans sp.]
MSRRLKILIFTSVTFAGLAGCSTYVVERRPAWRAEAENACLASGAVRESVSLRAAPEINGPGICGLNHPFKVTALADGAVTINSTQTLGCPMIAALDAWLKQVVQPAAMARFGEKVVRINSMGSYSCRGINNMAGAHLSEHAFGNAVDIGGFVLESGRELNIMRGFNGPDEQERAFLHEAHAGACGFFTTVLGPGYNIFHYNHFHVDLAMHGSTSRGPRRYCKPVPQTNLPEPPRKDNLPDPPTIDEEMDMARAPLPVDPAGAERPSLVASVPPAPMPRQAYAPVRQPPEAAVARAVAPTNRRPPPAISFSAEAPSFDAARPPTPIAPGAPRQLSAHQIPAGRRPPQDAGWQDPATDQGMGAETGDPPADEAAPGGRDDGSRARRRPAGEAPADWDLTSSIH